MQSEKFRYLGKVLRAICYHFAWHILENFPLTFRQRFWRSSNPAHNSISWIPVDSLEIVYEETHCQWSCSKLFILVSAVARGRTNLLKLTFKPLTVSARLLHGIYQKNYIDLAQVFVIYMLPLGHMHATEICGLVQSQHHQCTSASFIWAQYLLRCRL